MRTALTLPLVLAVALAQPAAAEFVVAESYDAPPADSTPRGAGVAPDGNAAPVAPVRRPAAVRPAPRVAVAHGFGQGVPLAFALRQIVPSGARVDLAEGVDPDAAVDWRGGREWNRVLSDAVSPLGLRLAPRRGGGWVVGP